MLADGEGEPGGEPEGEPNDDEDGNGEGSVTDAEVHPPRVNTVVTARAVVARAINRLRTVAHLAVGETGPACALESCR